MVLIINMIGGNKYFLFKEKFTQTFGSSCTLKHFFVVFFQALA